MPMTRETLDRAVAAFGASEEARSRGWLPQEQYVVPAEIADEVADLVRLVREEPYEAPGAVLDLLKYRAFNCTDYDIVSVAPYAADTDGDEGKTFPLDVLLFRIVDGLWVVIIYEYEWGTDSQHLNWHRVLPFAHEEHARATFAALRSVNTIWRLALPESAGRGDAAA